MSRAKFGEYANNIGTTVLCQGSWDDLKGASKSLVGPLMDTFDSLSFLHESTGEFHLEGTTTRAETRVLNDIASNTESVL